MNRSGSECDNAIARFAGAGFTLVHVHQVGPDQAGFLRFYERDVLRGLDG